MNSTEVTAKSDAFRSGLREQILGYASIMRNTREELTGDFFNRMDEASDFGSRLRPPIASSTRAKLNLAYNPRVYDHVSTSSQRSDLHRELVADAKLAIAADPYFSWLKTHLVDHRTHPETAGRFVDPLPLLFANLETSDVSYLPPDLSIIRVYRDFDPAVTSADRHFAEIILNLYAVETIVKSELDGRFDQRAPASISKEAWSLAMDIDSARQSYRLILDELNGYSSHITRESFEAFRNLITNGDPVYFSIINTMKAGSGTRLADQEDLNRIAAWKVRMHIDPALTSIQLFEMLYAAGTPGVSYEVFLLRVFGGNAAFRVENLIRSLQLIIEVADAGGALKTFMDYAQARVNRSTYLEYLSTPY